MPLNIQTKYMFDIHASVDAKPLGEVPGGFRVDLSFGADACVVTVKELLEKDWPVPEDEQPLWSGMEGKLISGGDWVTVFENGVVRLNGRATIQAIPELAEKPPEGVKPFLIDMFYAGVIDLVTDKWSKDVERTTYSKWKRGALGCGAIAVSLAVNFELAQGSEAWAQQIYNPPDGVYQKYARLARSQYIAVGEATLDKQPYSPITAIKLGVFEARVGP